MAGSLVHSRTNLSKKGTRSVLLGPISTLAGPSGTPGGAFGVLWLVGVRSLVEHDVLVVSIDRLTHVPRAVAGMR